MPATARRDPLTQAVFAHLSALQHAHQTISTAFQTLVLLLHVLVLWFAAGFPRHSPFQKIAFTPEAAIVVWTLVISCPLYSFIVSGVNIYKHYRNLALVRANSTELLGRQNSFQVLVAAHLNLLNLLVFGPFVLGFVLTRALVPESAFSSVVSDTNVSVYYWLIPPAILSLLGCIVDWAFVHSSFISPGLLASSSPINSILVWFNLLVTLLVNSMTVSRNNDAPAEGQQRFSPSFILLSVAAKTITPLLAVLVNHTSLVFYHKSGYQVFQSLHGGSLLWLVYSLTALSPQMRTWENSLTECLPIVAFFWLRLTHTLDPKRRVQIIHAKSVTLRDILLAILRLSQEEDKFESLVYFGYMQLAVERYSAHGNNRSFVGFVDESSNAHSSNRLELKESDSHEQKEFEVRKSRPRLIAYLFETIRGRTGELDARSMIHYMWFMAEMGFNLHYLSLVQHRLKASTLSLIQRFMLQTVEDNLSSKLSDLYHGRISPGMLANADTPHELVKGQKPKPKAATTGDQTDDLNPKMQETQVTPSGLDLNLFFSYSSLFETLGKQLRQATKAAMEFYDEVSLKSYDIGKLHNIARRVDREKQDAETIFKLIEEKTEETQCGHLIPFAKMLDSVCGDRTRARMLISTCEQRTQFFQKMNIHLNKNNKQEGQGIPTTTLLGTNHEWVSLSSSLEHSTLDRIDSVSKNSTIIFGTEESALVGKTISDLVGQGFKDIHTALVSAMTKSLPVGYLDFFKSRVISPQKNLFFHVMTLTKISPSVSAGLSAITILKRNCYHAPMIFVNNKGKIEGGNFAGLDLVTSLGQIDRSLADFCPQLERCRLSLLMAELVSKDGTAVQYLKDARVGKHANKKDVKTEIVESQEVSHELSPVPSPRSGSRRFGFGPDEMGELQIPNIKEGNKKQKSAADQPKEKQPEPDSTTTYQSYLHMHEDILRDLLTPMLTSNWNYKDLLGFYKRKFSGTNQVKSVSGKLFSKVKRRSSIQSMHPSKGSKGGEIDHTENDNSEFLKDFKEGQQILADFVGQVTIKDTHANYDSIIYLTDLSGILNMTTTLLDRAERGESQQSRDIAEPEEIHVEQTPQRLGVSGIDDQDHSLVPQIVQEDFRSAIDTPTFLGTHNDLPNHTDNQDNTDMLVTSRNRLDVKGKGVSRPILPNQDSAQKGTENMIVRVQSKKQSFVLGPKKKKIGLVAPLAYENQALEARKQQLSSSKHAELRGKEHSDSFAKANLDGQSSLSSNKVAVAATYQDLITKKLRWYGVFPVLLMLAIQIAYAAFSLYVQDEMNGSLNTQIRTLIYLRFTVYMMVHADTTRRTEVISIIHKLLEQRGLTSNRLRYAFADPKTTYDPVETLKEHHLISDKTWSELMQYMQTFKPEDVQKVFRFKSALSFWKNYNTVNDTSSATVLSLTLHANHLLIQGLASSYITEFTKYPNGVPSPVTGQLEPLASPKLAALIALTSDAHLSQNLVKYVATLLVTDQDEYLRLVAFVNRLVWLHYGSTGLALFAILGVIAYIRKKLRAVYLCFNKIRDFEITMARDNFSMILLSVEGMLKAKSALAAKPKYTALLANFPVEGVTIPRGKRPPQMPHIADLIIIRDTMNKENFSRFENGSRGKEQKIYRRGKLKLKNWFGMLFLALVFVVVFVTYGLFEYFISTDTSEANQFELAVMVINRAYGRLLYTSGLFVLQTYAVVLNQTSLGHPSISTAQNIKSISDMMANYDLHFGRMVKFLSTNSKATIASLGFDKFQRQPCPHFDLAKYNMTLDDCNQLADNSMSQDVMMVYQWIDNFMEKHLNTLKQANSSNALQIIEDPKFRMFEFVTNFLLFQLFPDFTEPFYDKLLAYHDSKTYWVSGVLLAVMWVCFGVILFMDVYSLRDLFAQITISLHALLLIPLESHHFNPHLKSALHMLSQSM